MTAATDGRHRASRSLAVVGGGISGLAAAWYAAAAGWDVTVYEATAQVGGKLATGVVADIPVDVGAESLLTTRPEAVGLISELGLDNERIAPLTIGASVRAEGVLHDLPAGTLMGIPTNLDAVRASGVLSAAGLLAVENEPTLPALPPLTGDVSVGGLVRSRVGNEVADRLVEPLLGGVWAGRADLLSLRATVPALAAALADGGSLVQAAGAITGGGTRAPAPRTIFTSLRGGIGRLPGAMAASGRFAVQTGVTVRTIVRTDGHFALDVGAVRREEQVPADAVIVAAPAAKAARLLGVLARGAATELAGIDSANLAIVSFAFRDVVLPPGTGMLVAAGERLATKAVTLTSQKWDVGGATTLLRASVGRAGENQALRLDDADLVELVRRELRPLLGLDATPIDAVVTRWGGGLPQYAVGHVERVARIRDAVGAVPGLAVCGAAYDGVGVPACIASARAAVAQVGPVAADAAARAQSGA